MLAKALTQLVAHRGACVAEITADVGWISESAERVREDGLVQPRTGCESNTEPAQQPGGQAEHTCACARLRRFAKQPRPLHPDDRVGDFDLTRILVDLLPENGERLADANARAEHELTQIRQVLADRTRIGSEPVKPTPSARRR